MLRSINHINIRRYFRYNKAGTAVADPLYAQFSFLRELRVVAAPSINGRSRDLKQSHQIIDCGDLNAAMQCHKEEPTLDFLCGYRKECVWDGAAISYLSENSIGWGNIGTLSSAASNGSANVAEHKDYFFSHRLIRQYPLVAGVERQFDRIFLITLKSGRSFRVAMVKEYEPCGDAIRKIWDTFGPVDIAWNINPNGNPTSSARQVGAELGCEVIKWDEFKAYIHKG